jgi:SAM-dependent methyltransferase
MGHSHYAFDTRRPPPEWMLQRPKGLLRHVYDLIGSPLRMVLLPDSSSEKLRLTSLRAERMGMVLPELKGRVLDVGAGDNLLIRLYKQRGTPDALASTGVDTVDWGGGCTIVQTSATLPFPDASFDTVCFIACLNHIPERLEALREARRLLKPKGRLLITMIGRWIGELGHTLWWYSEEKHRHTDAHEEGGLDRDVVIQLIDQAGFQLVLEKPFTYRLNKLYIAQPR